MMSSVGRKLVPDAGEQEVLSSMRYPERSRIRVSVVPLSWSKRAGGCPAPGERTKTRSPKDEIPVSVCPANAMTLEVER